jgi:glucokinase
MEDRNKILSVDIGGSTCKIGLVDARGEVLEFERYDTEDVRQWGAQGFVDRLKPFESDYSVDGITLGVPAMVDWDHNHIRSACEEVPWLEDSSNKKLIQDQLHRPVLLVNDVEALLVGEWFWGELKGLDTGVVLSLGTSMGSALLWNETPQQGRRGSIMDLELVSLNTYGENSDGFPPGHASQWLSGAGLKKKMRDEAEVRPLSKFFRTDDEPYVRIRETFEDKLAHLLGTIVVMLDPERIVLAGGLTRSEDEWLSPVEDKMNDYITDEFKGVPSVTLAQLRNEDVVKGPAAFWDWTRDDS